MKQRDNCRLRCHRGYSRLKYRNMDSHRSWPESEIITGTRVEPLSLPTCAIDNNTSNPSITFPNTTCLPSSQGVADVVKKNWDPLVFGPELAIERMPGSVCFKIKFSSLKDSP
mmetsp:Transcript_34766/g.80368  ORF Transcript_34766/g.80368 Transcript_34766/m.80368 type:complete len:113 (-) Transcript_34766:231-569(-)